MKIGDLRVRIDNRNGNDAFHHSIFSDEAVFHVNGEVNLRNRRFGAKENPHVQTEKLQDRHSIAIWCMLDPKELIVFDISTETMKGARY